MNSSEMIVQVCPDMETIKSRMKTVSDIGGDVERFQRQFAEKLGGGERNQGGINLQFELCVVDLARMEGATPFIYGILTMDFDEYIEAIFVESPEFAKSCIEYRQMIKELSK